MAEWNGEERRQEVRSEFCQAHIPMTNAITRMETMLANIEKATTQGLTFKTAIVGSIILIVLTIIGQGVLYGRLLEKVDSNVSTIVKIDTAVQAMRIVQAEQGKQIQINTERWNRYLDKSVEKK